MRNRAIGFKTTPADCVRGWLQAAAKRLFDWGFTILILCFLSQGPICAAAEHYPHEVLSGTDIVDIDEFSISKDAKPGSVNAETGGALLELSIAQQGKSIDVHRTFSEPGITAKEKSYKNLVKLTDGTFQSRNVVLRFVKDGGVLMLEKASGVDGIPNNTWILYSPKQTR